MSLKEVIIEAVETLNYGGYFSLSLELIAESINNNLLDINDVIEMLQEIALDNDEHIDQAIEILNDNGIEIPIEVKNRQFTINIKNRLEEILLYIHKDDLKQITNSRIQGILYDLENYLSEINGSPKKERMNERAKKRCNDE